MFGRYEIYFNIMGYAWTYSKCWDEYVPHHQYCLFYSSKYQKWIDLIACSCGPSIQTVSVKETKHLELSEKIWLCVKKYLIKFLPNFSSIREKIQTPWTIRFYVVKNTSMNIILWGKKHKFWDLAMFPKNILFG